MDAIAANARVILPHANIKVGAFSAWPAPAGAAWRVQRASGGSFLQLKDSATGLFGSVFLTDGVLTTGVQVL